ncbi:MAG: cytosine methyltransferase [Opitutae bacterium]|nr:cytosine methyltransferase [Opitutae bacterium]|tara:strand:- start:5750 stop:6829 length:1080 start_codon:yes stop_codon:yes gene_type:complete
MTDNCSLVSLYSGCGGFDIGLSKAGFDTVFATDLEEDCCNSLVANSISTNIFQSPIEDITKTAIIKKTGLRAGELDLLAGGPPCPAYSKSRFYRKEKPHGMDDPSSHTLFDFFKFVDVLKPKVFIMENVPGLMFKRQKGAFEAVLKSARDLKYDVSYAVLNSVEYGVPQIRERLFIVGTQKKYQFTFPPKTHKKNPINENQRSLDLFEDILLDPVTAGEVIGDLDTEENASDLGHKAGGRHHHLLEKVPPGDNYLFFTEKRGHPNPEFVWRSRYWSFLLKLSPAKPSWTIQARRSNNMGPFHWRNRILRIEEVKRLQTFPDEYKLTGNIDSQWRQVGNAVPPKLALRIGEQLIKCLKNG